MNSLAQLRQAVFDIGDWSPVQSDEAVARADRFLNRVLQKLPHKFPRLFERQITVWSQPDSNSVAGDATDRLNAVLDGTLAWVMELQKAPATVDWETDGSWEGRQLEYQDADGAWHSNLIREVWTDPVSGLYRLSLLHPIENTTDSEYRIWTPQLVLPGDVIKVRNPWMYTSLGETPLFFNDGGAPQVYDLNQLFELRAQVDSYGTPNTIWPGPQFSLPGPEEKPVVKDSPEQQGATWDGPDPPGTFEYRITYTWGRRPTDTLSPGLGLREPLFESAPSPVSDTRTVVAGGPATLIKLPAIDWMLNFYNALGGGAPYERDQKSGIRIRIWRRRTASTSSGGTVDHESVYDTFGWCLLAEVDGHVATYTDDGSVLVDRRRRLKTVLHYDSIMIWPRPTEVAEIRMDAVLRPQPLEHDNDSPVMAEEGLGYLIYSAAHLLYMSLNEKTWAESALDLAQIEEADLAKHRGRLTNHRRRRRLSRGGRHRTQ